MSTKYSIQKNKENQKKHGVSFDDIDKFDWDTSITKEDTRYEYGEDRFISYGFVDSRLYVLVWTLRESDIRPISFRKANKREVTRYEKDKFR